MARTLSAQEKAARDRAKRDKKIRQEGKWGYPVEALASRFGLSVSRIREILKAED